MACMVMAYMVMAYMVMSYIVMAWRPTEYGEGLSSAVGYMVLCPGHGGGRFGFGVDKTKVFTVGQLKMTVVG